MNPDSAKYEEHKLVSLLAEDSQYAFQLVYDRHRNRVYQTAIRYLKSPQLAQEVVQDVFLKLWFERRQLHRFSPLEAWVFTVARNNILNRLKRLSVEWKALHQLSLSGAEADLSAAYKLEDAQYRKMLLEVLNDLPAQQRQVFDLARIEKLSYAEIGERLSLSALTVKTHMARALQHIRRNLRRKGVEIPLIFLFLQNF